MAWRTAIDRRAAINGMPCRVTLGQPRANRDHPVAPEARQAEGAVAANEETERLLNKYGRMPNARLRSVDQWVAGLVAVDLELVFALSHAEDTVLRRVARWTALRSLDPAGLTLHPAIAPAVSALRAGKPLPLPFSDPDGWRSVADQITTLT